MYSRQHRTSNNSSNSSDKPAPNQFAPRPFVVQRKTEEVAPQQDQTPEEQTQKEEAKQYKSAFIDASKFTPRPPAKTPRVQMKLTLGQPGDMYQQQTVLSNPVAIQPQANTDLSPAQNPKLEPEVKADEVSNKALEIQRLSESGDNGDEDANVHLGEPIAPSARLALAPTQLPPIPNSILRQTVQGSVTQKLLWQRFWQLVGKKFGVRITAAGAAAIADGPLPFGDLISAGLALWMVWDLVENWDTYWQETVKEVEREQTVPQAIPQTDADAIPRPNTQKQKQDINFYHGTDEATAKKFQGGLPVRAIGGGEFGQGFYTFIEQNPAEIVAAEYTRNRRPPLPKWGVVKFMIPVDIFAQYFGIGAIAALMQGKLGNILYFPDQQTPVEVTYPNDVLPGFKQSFTWKEFVEKNRQLRRENKKDMSWPYDLIVGPLKGKVEGYKYGVNQFMFNQKGVSMLNDKKVKRNVVAQGDTGI